MAEFTSERAYIHELLGGDYKKYIIPQYQRPYSWDCIGKNDKNNQINAMWDDLITFYRTKDEQNVRPYYFMGSMVLAPFENSNIEFEVIDGQQRLTSLLILFSALKNVLIKEKIKNIDIELKESLDKLIGRIDKILFDTNSDIADEKKVKILNSSGFNYDVVLLSVMKCDEKPTLFLEAAEGNEEYKTVINRYFNNRRYFEEEIKKEFLKNMLIITNNEIIKFKDFFDTLNTKVAVVKTLAPDFEMAFHVFEILNNRGLPLTNRDLFKNFLIQEFTTVNKIENTNIQPSYKWKEFEDAFIKDDFISRWVESKKAGQQKSSAFNDIKQIYNENYLKDKVLTFSKLNTFLIDIKTDLNYYNLIVRENEIQDEKISNKVKFLLRAGNFRYTTNLLIALFRNTNYDGHTNSQVLKFLTTYECYILNILPNISPRRFSYGPIYSAIKFLNSDDFGQALNTISISDYDKEILFDYINGNNISRDNDFFKLVYAKFIWTLESKYAHSDSWEYLDFDKYYIDYLSPSENAEFRLCNLIAVPLIAKSSIKNATYKEKLSFYSNFKIKYLNDLANTLVLDEEYLNERQNRIIDIICEDLEIPKPNIEKNNFIENIIEDDLKSGKHETITTRFPPEPNGYLHIGHAKSICLNFGLSKKYGGKTNLRFDDTNPTKEDIEYVDSIREDVQWLIEPLGISWAAEHYASDYFDTIYELTLKLIQKGLAYIDDSSAEEIAAMKGTPTQAGVNSPFRQRSVEENMDLFVRMKNGEFTEGSHILRAKIDMASPNMHMRDPLLYRIKFANHHQTGDKWCIYPMYDYAHPISDAIENITHSVCTLEFEVHRPLYDWTIKNLDVFPSRQIEFARLNLTYTIMSKRKLLQLVQENVVSSWDDPRMPTISGLRRRGYTPQSLHEFANRIGVAKRDNVIDVSLLEFCLREDLNKKAHRIMAVLNPLKVVITNYTGSETVEIENNHEDENAGKRQVPFSNEIYIEQDDFMENPPKGFHRLTPDGYFRLKGAYIIKHVETIKNTEGGIEEVRCEYIPTSRSGNDQSGIKVKGVGHWVSASDAVTAECRLYDRLFTVEEPDGDRDRSFLEFINPDSLTVLPKIYVEPSVKNLKTGDRVQFLRHGYFCVDKDSTSDKLVFNRTVTLKDGWSKDLKK